jgi:hypothetical protein
VNDDGYADVVTAPGYGAGAHITVFDGRSLALGLGPVHDADFYMYDPSMISGVEIAVADLSGDGYADIIAAPSTGSSNLRIVSGYALSSGEGPVALASMYTWPPNGSGMHLAVTDAAGTGNPELIVSSSDPDNGNVGILSAADLLENNPFGLEWLDPLPGLRSSVYVG